ncbi:cytochrome P450 [Xylaria palmicola]|nr:cytochrome P450 [Xylaria palmicola]
MFLEVALVLLATVSILGIFNAILRPKNDFTRVGADPGPIGLRTWWARWKWYKGGHEQVRQRYKEDDSYVVQTLMGDTVVLSPKCLHELKMLPESKLSSAEALVDSVMGKYTGVDLLLRDHLTSDICRGLFKRSIPEFLPQMAEKLDMILAERLSGNTARGRPYPYFSFHANPIWQTALTDLPVNIEITKFILLPLPAISRPFIAPLIPQRRHLLFPRSDELATAGKESSVMRLFIESGKDNDPDSIAASVILHTYSMAITNVMFDLCAMPKYINTLRSEAEEALSDEGGQWRMSTIEQLRRLDSFLKESQRLNHTTFLGFDRKVISAIRLSDGKTVLPAGASIAMPGRPMSVDPTFYERPHEFDGLRFYCTGKGTEEYLSKLKGNTQQQLDYTGIEPGNLSWGSGRFTCPGRWYAAALIKLVVAKLLLSYDISFPLEQTQRPGNTMYDTEVFPDMKQRIVLRKRDGAGVEGEVSE